MADFTFNPLLDPARGKKAAVSSGNTDYPARVAAYNSWLYTPMDRRPDPPVNPLAQYTAPGWHGPTAPVAPGSYNTPYGTASVSNPMWNIQTAPTATLPVQGGVPMAGAAGPSGPLGTEPSIIDTAPKATYTPPQSSMAPPSPPQNSMQRWQQQAQNGPKPLSDQRRYFWATGHIDARARPSPQNSSPAPVQFKNSPTNWAPY